MRLCIGNFQQSDRGNQMEPADLLKLLQSADCNQIVDTCSLNEQVISDEDLASLLDRSKMTSGQVSFNDKHNRSFKVVLESDDGVVLPL